MLGDFLPCEGEGFAPGHVLLEEALETVLRYRSQVVPTRVHGTKGQQGVTKAYISSGRKDHAGYLGVIRGCWGHDDD